MAFALEESLRGTDALCERWAREAWDWPRRDANPIYRGMRERAGASQPGPTPEMSDEVLTLDRILAHSEPRYFALIKVWYVGTDTIDAKAKKLSTNRTTLYAMWRRTLEYLRGRLHAVDIYV